VDRQIRRAHRDVHSDALNGHPDLDDLVGNGILAFPADRSVVGMAGGSFTVGIAYCARWFPKERQGLAMGIFGAGNTGLPSPSCSRPSS